MVSNNVNRSDCFLLLFRIQYRDIPEGMLPPSTPKFAYGQVQMKKVNNFYCCNMIYISSLCFI